MNSTASFITGPEGHRGRDQPAKPFSCPEEEALVSSPQGPSVGSWSPGLAALLLGQIQRGIEEILK